MLVTDKPQDLASGNDLDDLPDDLLSTPAAYLSFGTGPCALEDPPEIDEVRTYIVRCRCTGKTEKERTDGEMRHGRQLAIQAVWIPGQQPPSTDDDQPGLLDHDGNIDPDAIADEQDDDEQDHDDDGTDSNPAFSHGGTDD